MTAAFIFGFADLYIDKNFERLHIFLFNLTSGGFTILYLTESRRIPSARTILFFILSIVYAVLAFFEIYTAAAVTGLVLAVIVEICRERRLNFFPGHFFKIDEDTSSKFHDASLLCLVMALCLSSLVIFNEVYFHLFKLEKLTLNVFFLGFSFPVSLITFSIIFGIIDKEKFRLLTIAEHLFFWFICGGVIIFFILIIMQSFPGEVFISFFLFFTVLAIFIAFFRYGSRMQQKYFLVSGMYFLLFSALTGIVYIVLSKFTFYKDYGKIVLRIHAFASLYGWNLTGMMVILRWDDFPIALNTGKILYFHWFIIMFLAPLAKFYSPLAVPAVVTYTIFITIFFFSKNKIRRT